MMDINIGDIVEVIPQDDKPWTLDWREQFVVVGINAKRVLQYDISALDYTIVPVGHPKDGGTDGFAAEDLRVVKAAMPPAQAVAVAPLQPTYAPCSGCGAKNPGQRCLGCRHQFDRDTQEQTARAAPHNARTAEIIGYYLHGEKRTVYPGQAADDVRHLLSVMGQPVAVRVKPLKWRQNTEGGFQASGLFGDFYIVWQPGTAATLYANGLYHGEASDVDAAKLRAQTAENAAVLSAIDARSEAEVRQDERQKIAAAILENPQLDLRADEASRLASALLHGVAREILKNHDYNLSKFRGRPEAAVKAEALREVAVLIGVEAEKSNTPPVHSAFRHAAIICRAEADRLEKKGDAS